MYIKKIKCPYCGKELINLNIYGDNDFWCDDCNIDFIIENETIITDLCASATD